MEIKKLNKSNLIDVVYLENELFSNPFSEKSCLNELTTVHRRYYGLFDENQLIGYVGASISCDVADIIKLGVLKTEQGKGYGKQLLNYLIESLKIEHIKEIILEVEHENYKAINLYLNAGFKEISMRKNYYGENSHAKILKLELT